MSETNREPETPETESWDVLTDLIARHVDEDVLSEMVSDLPAHERARALAHMSEPEHVQLLDTLTPEHAAELLDDLPDAQAADLLEEVGAETAAAIVDEIDSDDRADILSQVRAGVADSILAEMKPREAALVRELMEYPGDVAGGIMIKEYLAYPSTSTLADIHADLQAKADEYGHYDVQYIYITEPDGRLAGVLRMRDMLMRPRMTPVADLIQRDAVTVDVRATLEELEDMFDDRPYLGIPVVDDAGHLCGVILRGDVEEAIGERADEQFRAASGIVGGEELRSMPFVQRATRRLSWLSPNLVLNLISVSVIALYQDTLEAAIALAVFMPIISDMSGCSGNQAVAVSIRELTLGLVDPRELMRVFSKEVRIGLVNGLVLGLLLCGIAMIYSSLGPSSMNPWLGMVVGIALFANTVIAVSLGGLIPLALKRFGQDPALASGPILTTVTDLCGFFLVLSIAGQILPRLGS